MVGKPVWTTSSFLLYAGGLTVLGGASGALTYLSGQYGKAAFAGWAALIVVVLYAIANAFKLRGRWITAGVFAFASVIAWGAFVGALWSWFGWLKHWDSAFRGFSVAHLSLELLVLVAAWNARRRFAFPFITAISVAVGWFFVTDLVSNGGNWSVVVTLLVGLAYLLAGSASDKPSAFWLHLAGGALIGGSLLHWWHTTDTDWALISAVALVFVMVAYATKRSSWAVLGAIGFFAVTGHFTFAPTFGGFSFSSQPSITGWVPPVAFSALGFWLVLLGLMSRRRAAAAQ